MNTKMIEEILVPYLTDNGFKLYDVSFVKEAGMHILRVLVYHKSNKKISLKIYRLRYINVIAFDEFFLKLRVRRVKI